MPGGSTDPGDNDTQCIHCGLYYSLAGIRNHEDSCDYAEVSHRVQPLTDGYALRRAESADGVEVDTDEVPGPDPAPDPADGPGPDDDREPEPSPDPTPDTPRGRTDGGPQAPPTGPKIDDDPVDETETEDGCPECGSTESIPIDNVPDRLIEAVPQLAKFEQLCEPCSTTEDGKLTSPVEAY